MKRLLLTLTILICFAAPVLAWSGPGHMVATAIAYRNLSPGDRQKLDALLANHPKAAQWRASYPSNIPGLTPGLYAAMQASLYPDEIRDYNNPGTYPNWHFVDYPLLPPNFPMRGSPTPNDDVIFGIGKSQAVMRTGSASARDKAFMASFLIHTVGDVHQPMHCATLITPQFPAPEGDRGGNKLFIRPAPNRSATKLHSFWDQLLGSDKTKIREALNTAIALGTRYSRTNLPELGQHPSPKDWSLESRKFAIENAYLNGNLRYGRDEAHAGTAPAGYTSTAKAIAERRVALAGYRLADTLHRALR